MSTDADSLLEALGRASDGVFVVDQDYRISYWSDEASRILGHTAEDVVGRTCYDVLRGLDAAGNPYCHHDCDPMLCTLLGGKTPTYDIETQRPGGQRLWLNVTVIGFPSGNDGAQAVHLFRNVTRQRRAQALAERVVETVAQLGPATEETLPTSTEAPPTLTRRELEVLQLLSAGLKTEHIAERLRISRLTARNHIQRILGKLGVQRRSEAVSYAFRHGLT